jgi:hypothetical protein
MPIREELYIDPVIRKKVKDIESKKDVRSKKIVAIRGGKFFSAYDSPESAQKALGVRASNIYTCCFNNKGRTKKFRTCQGFVFFHECDFETWQHALYKNSQDIIDEAQDYAERCSGIVVPIDAVRKAIDRKREEAYEDVISILERIWKAEGRKDATDIKRLIKTNLGMYDYQKKQVR